MKKLAAVFVFVMIGQNAMSQVTFEKVYDFWDSFQFFGVYPVHDGYILSGTRIHKDLSQPGQRVYQCFRK